jgi:hypothetical protein
MQSINSLTSREEQMGAPTKIKVGNQIEDKGSETPIFVNEKYWLGFLESQRYYISRLNKGLHFDSSS